MTYKELIEETGAEIGLEGFTPDADGVCVIASEIGEIVIMDCSEGGVETVLLNAAVSDVPSDADAALLEALKANCGFTGTKGSTLSIDAETKRFELTRYEVLQDLNPDKLIAIIEDFATALVDLRKRLDGNRPSDSQSEASESPSTENFIRV